jgi:CBS domain containing-hemolysin-like protein
MGSKYRIVSSIKRKLNSLFAGKVDCASTRDSIVSLSGNESNDCGNRDDDDPLGSSKNRSTSSTRSFIGNVSSNSEVGDSEVNIPRIDIVAVPADAKVRNVVQAFVDSRKSSLLLVYKTKEDSRGISVSGTKALLVNVLNLRELEAHDVMVPRVDVIAIPLKSKVRDVVQVFIESRKSSLLVYKTKLDDVVGVLRLKDVAGWFVMSSPFNISLFVKDVLFVPPNMPVLDLLYEMKETGNEFAVVVDEYGGVSGIVTLSCIVEKIVGTVHNVHDFRFRKSRVVRCEDSSVSVDPKVSLEELDELSGISIASDDSSIDTVGGFLFSIAGKIPEKGERFLCEEQNLEFEVLDADHRKINRIKIRRM